MRDSADANSEETKKAELRAKKCGDQTWAHIYARQFVKRRLKAPATADFASILSSKIREESCGLWKVRSHVDSKNGFGAMVRTHYVARLRFHGNDRWQLLHLETRP